MRRRAGRRRRLIPDDEPAALTRRPSRREKPDGFHNWRPCPAAYHHGRCRRRPRSRPHRGRAGLDGKLRRCRNDIRAHDVGVLIPEYVSVTVHVRRHGQDAGQRDVRHPSLHAHGQWFRLGQAGHPDGLVARARWHAASPRHRAGAGQCRAAPPRGCAALPFCGHCPSAAPARRGGQVSMRDGSSSVAPLTMKSRRGATSVPISRSNMPLAASASSIRIRRSIRRRGSIVVSAS